MRTAAEIYEKYRIPPWLQMHQLRVAAVGKLVAESIAGTDIHTIVSACLLHDMGAIVKFDFSYRSSGRDKLYDEEDIKHWTIVQKEFRTKYGEKEHEATDAILQELHVPDTVRHLVGGTGLAKAKEIVETGSIEVQIIEYADQRVGPHGVLPLAERLADMKKRYSPRWGKDSYIEREAQFDTSAEAVMQLEQKLLPLSSRNIANISDDDVASLIEELRTGVL